MVLLNKRLLRIPVFVAILCAAGLSARASAADRPLPIAGAARTLSVSDAITAHLVSHRGATVLNEDGQASGTLACSSLTIEITISYTTAAITFNCPTRYGDVSGHGETSFYASGSLAYFHGNVGVTHGTGQYARAGGSKLYLNGTMHRGSYSIKASVTGSLAL